MPKIQTTRVYAEIQKAYERGYTTVSEQGAARASKTYNTVIWLVVFCLQHPHTTVSIVRATLPAIKGSVLRDFHEIVERLGVEISANKSELIYRFRNGSFVEFFSTDNEQKLRGRKRNILYVNEANELKYIEWQQLQMRTTAFSIIDYNPSFTDSHWIVALNKEPKTYHFITTYKDNPFLEQKVVDEIEALRGKNKSLWQIYGLGQMAQVEGLIFENVSVIEKVPRWSMKHHFRGIDYGYSHDPTAIVDVFIDGKDLYIDELCYRTHMLTGDIIQALKQADADAHQQVETVSESADPRMIDEIYNAGIDIKPVHKYGGSVMSGITKMLEYRIFITRRSQNALKEFRSYTYRQDKEGHWLNEPIDTFNHIIDSVRYVILEKVLGANAQSLSAEEILDIL